MSFVNCVEFLMLKTNGKGTYLCISLLDVVLDGCTIYILLLVLTQRDVLYNIQGVSRL